MLYEHLLGENHLVDSIGVLSLMAKNNRPKSKNSNRLSPVQSEVEAYGFIRQQLRDLGWVLKDPSKNANGQVWTQNQCLAHQTIKTAFGAKHPENIVKLSENTVVA